jgi:uncharacterized protein YkwD
MKSLLTRIVFSAFILASTALTGAAQTPTLTSEQWSFLTLINNYRSQNGAGPLQVSVTLQDSSQWMSTDMATKNYFGHTDSLGRDPFTRIASFGYPSSTEGENIAAGYSYAQNTFNQWQTACDADSTGACTYAHRQNMLNPAYKVLGIGRAYNASSTYQWYWTTDLGSYVDQIVTPPSSSAPTVNSVAPINGSGSPKTFTATYSSSAGAADLAEEHLLFNSSLTAAGGCWVYYVHSSNLIYLSNDAGNGLVSGSIHPGTAGTLSNSQCTIGNAGAITASGTTLSLPVTVTFASGFTGTKNVYGYASNNEGLNSGWVSLGTWTPSSPAAPSVVSISPVNGSGSPAAFTATYASPAGASDIGDAYLYIGAALTGSGACWVYYVHSSNLIYLVNDAGTGLASGSIRPGTSGTLANSQCTISSARALSSSGNNLTLPISITFNSGFIGTKNVYGFTTNNEGQNSGWVLKGIWKTH